VEGVQGRAERLSVTERSAAHPEEVAREQLGQNRGLRLFAWGALLFEAAFYLVEWWRPALAEKTEMMLVGLGLFASVVIVLVTVWKRSSPVLQRDRVYLLVGAALGLAFLELALGLAFGIVSAFRPGVASWTAWAPLASALWRLALGGAALVLEMRRR